MAYATARVARITGVNAKTLHYWDRIGLVKPSVQRARGRGTKKLYGFPDLVAIAAARELRRAGLAGSGLRRLVNHIKRRRGLKRLSAPLFLLTDGHGLEEAADPCGAGGLGGHAFVLDLHRVTTAVRTAIAREEDACAAEA